MNKLLLLLFFIMGFTPLAIGQVQVSGVVLDGVDSLPLPSAHVKVLSLPDSAMIGTGTDMDGEFIISVKPNSEIEITISFISFEPYKQIIKVKQSPINLGTIVLQESSTQLEGVEVVVERVSVTQSGDTAAYNAEAFKTNPDATTEELVTKMPGVQIIDGKVQVQGEEVKQILVDGKPYFGDNPNAVLKNLPANFVDKVQVYNQLSDQAKFTGFDDGSATKVINIITKPENRNGQFGKFYGGYGYDNKYNAGAMVNLFNKDRRITLLGQSNNINEQNFSTVDLLGVTGSGDRRGGNRSSGFNTGNFMVNSREGITTTHAFGLNYSDKWGEKVEVSGSYFFNYGNNETRRVLQREYVLASDSGLLYNENSITDSRNQNHQFNFRLNYEIDSNNTLLIQPKLSVQHNHGNSNFYGAFTNREGLRNDTRNYYSSDLLGMNFSNSILYRHRFAKKGRTLSVTLNHGNTYNHSESNLAAANGYYLDTPSMDSINQTVDALGKGWNLGNSTVYTEPAGKHGQLQFRHETSFTHDKSDRNTLSYNSTTGEFTERDPELSIEFASYYLLQRIGSGYMMNKGKSQLALNVNYQWAHLNSEQHFPLVQDFSRSFHTVLPDAKYKYSFSKTKNLEFNYRTLTRAPSIGQLQNVLNNSNPLQLSIGNPELRQQYQHTVSGRYNTANADKGTSFFASLNATAIQRIITNASYISGTDTVINGIALAPGVQLSMPVNLDGYYSVSGNANYSLPVKPLKSKLSISLNSGFTRRPGVVNSLLNYSNTPTVGLGLVLGSNISQAIDFTVTSRSNMSFVSNSIQTQLNTRYFTQFTSGKITVSFWKGMVAQTEVRHNFFVGLQGGFNQNFVLWNASVAKKFLKENRGELRLTVYDILNQNNSIRRNVTELYIEDSQTNVLNRYVMLTFTYNLQHFKKV